MKNEGEPKKKNEGEQKSYHYWDFAGQITARLNQTFVLLGGVTLVAVAEAVCIFVLVRQVQHPPIFHVHPNGEVTVAGAQSDGPPPPRVHFLPTTEMPPDEVQIHHFLRVFLTKYLSYTPATADANLAAAFNMMTLNLRQASLKKMRDENEFEKIQEQRIVSNFSLVRIDPLRDVNLAYSVLGVREVHHLEGGKETVSKIVAHYNVRLAPAMRTEFDSSGLRVADFWEEQVLGEQDNQLNQPDDLTHTAAARQAQSANEP
jgi:type IV secretory pathway TrbF-like protein